MNTVILEMQGIDKAFVGVQALKNASLELKRGEVHALMGENGAGKSTLMKILTGIHEKDAGTIKYEGREVVYTNPKEAQEDGIVIVHQELNMMTHLTVAQNLFIGQEIMSGKFINDKKMNEEAVKVFSLLNIELDPTTIMGGLTVGRQQMVEIAKAIATEAKIIIFDEPTAALTETESADLFKIIADLRSQGIGIVYISHRMDEINQITDRITVLRDGEYVGTLITKDSTRDELINMMVGRTVYEEPKQKSNVAKDAPVVLSVRNLSNGGIVEDVSFDLHKGEILGFSGLMGSGRTEVARALFGADDMPVGEIYVNGKKVDIFTPKDAVNAGIGYLSEDRRRYGVIVDKSVEDNSVLVALDDFTSGLFIDEKKVKEVTKKYVDALKTRTPSTTQLVKNLSGGNQQKVVIAKWLVNDSEILIFDEPTRGIDVGAKSEIYTLMNELVAAGKSIIMISSDLPEILRMSDRIAVMCEGHKTGELSIEEATQEKIMQLATARL